MRRKWLIGTMFLIAVLEMWTMALASAQYQCNFYNYACDPSRNVTQCMGSCAGTGYTNCTTLVVKAYTGNFIYLSSKPGPCATVIGSDKNCWMQYPCKLKTYGYQSCQSRDGGSYCTGTPGFPSNTCTNCNWFEEDGVMNTTSTYVCSDCGE